MPPVIEPRQIPTLSGFKPVSAEEISRIIGASPSKHCLLDPAPTWLIKQLLPDLAETIAKMCNMSLEEGIFPNSLKSTIVRPRLKKTNLDPEDMNSFRPISNLTFLSKTVERAVAIRFVEHSELHKLLPHHPSAYRSSHSTETAVLAVHNDLVRMMDIGNVSALVLLDLSATLDTVDHSIMLQVLQDQFCVEGRPLEWIESYLCDRTQTHQVKDQQSRTLQSRLLSMRHHINTVVRSCFFHLRRLKSVRRILGAEVTSGLVSAFVTTRLDYCNSVLAGLQTIYDWSTSTCSECGGQACCRNRNSGPHHSSPPVPTLASDQVPHYLQALLAHASGASWSQHCVPVGHDDIRRWLAWSWETKILQQLPIWTSTFETKVRRAEFLILRTECMEFSSVQSPGTHKHWYLQKTVEYSPF